ncbi:MAG TPA: HAD hydrolase-like protein, partial [Candidatus Hydrogenedentes bacterium]|nr:HAD hydrolase-like protein [Candidatus Hydrogenedentota bacterium]
DSLDVFFNEFTAVCADMGFDRLNSRETFLRLFETNLLAGLVKAGFPVWKLKKLVRAFAPRIAEANARVPPFDGMPGILNRLAARFPLYFITSNTSAAILAFTEHHAIDGFRDVLGADKEPSKVKKIRQVRAAHPGAAAYYVGDTKGDMIEAREAGATAVAAAWGWHPVEKLREGAPDVLLREPADLLAFFGLAADAP